MKLFADLHIHSRYARACSKELNFENLVYWARIKGLNLVGTGDFTHPLWLREAQERLEELGTGFLRLKDSFAKTVEHKGSGDDPWFVLTGEVSLIFSRKGTVKRIHVVVVAPDFATVKKINRELSFRGNLESDGRPMLGMDVKEFMKILLDVNRDCLVIPAHCLLPDTFVHTKESFLAPIKSIQEGEFVYTHEKKWRKVSKVLRRPYQGNVFHIKPYYFRNGLVTTPEHPFFAIKTQKDCHWSGGICKPSHTHNHDCTKKHYQRYQPSWVPAAALERGDVLLFPRFLDAYANHAVVNVQEFVSKEIHFDSPTHVWGRGTRSAKIPKYLPITKEFCRLMGYFLSEGCVNGRDAVSFTFHQDEEAYMYDVVNLMCSTFGLEKPKYRTLVGKGVEFVFYARIVQEVFANLCYSERLHSAATKAMPLWALGLDLELQAELFKGWWRGDKGYTSSRMLLNQLKILLLRLGIIPSMRADSIEDHKRRGGHILEGREAVARYSNYRISNLTFFDDPFGLLKEPEFACFQRKSPIRHGWIDSRYAYLPIRDIETRPYQGEVYNLEVEEDNSYVCEFATVHNCWTPWFSLFGSMSGFDSLEECFGDFAPRIHAVETGLSSDPAMNWRLSQLDRLSIVSFSDAHSPQPHRMGREATIFEVKESRFENLQQALQAKSGENRILFTIEFFPEEGKYHFDGHRNCGIVFSPEESVAHNLRCPSCGRQLTIGVMHRVAKLADRPSGYQPSNRPPFHSLVPLAEVISKVFKTQVWSKKVQQVYFPLIERFGNEFAVMLDVDLAQIKKIASDEIAAGIGRVREGKVRIEPGYDGEYGKVELFHEAGTVSTGVSAASQKRLF